MANWQRTARLVVVVAALGVALAIALTVKRRTPVSVEPPVARTDPTAVVEGAGGLTFRVNREHEEIRVVYERLLTYANNSTKMLGVKVTTERAGGRVFTITGKEGQVGQHDSTVSVVGDVVVSATDGMVVKTDRATYTEADGLVRVPGPLEFARGRVKGTGTGGTYDKARDVLTIADRVAVHMDADRAGTGAMDVEAGTLEFRRDEKIIRFDGLVKVTDRKSTRLNSSHIQKSRMPSSA